MHTLIAEANRAPCACGCGTLIRVVDPSRKTHRFAVGHAARVQPRRPIEERFWKKVLKTDMCWLWTAATDGHGYGVLGIGRRGDGNMKAHRFSYELRYGPLPPDRHVLHNCPSGDNPRCVRPEHLFLGDQAANNRDMFAKQRHSFGEGHYAAKLTEADARQVFLDRQSGKTFKEIGARFGVTESAVRGIFHGKRWRHVGRSPTA